ncbi:Txe/YoeB family addiction module toxin [Flavobacterium sandaracinum]|uniref:Putative mRNA interferase YoeB n=1 Tax=Flavobacterium sandaracinum TaxID=2541733 RepID=A0A4V2Z137_9FLAO|nr:Txe/YoeB family addiction module toxin [Flavobacterium sandaracinum]TDE03298.1 Txe/YoeB family addiction module toxin [Flavobacterium sandaracinum]
MEVKLTKKALEQLDFWKRSGNKAIQKKIQLLVVHILKTPFKGIGKPEALKYNLQGTWSRKINEEHRIVYEIPDEGILLVHSLKGHYTDLDI